MNGGTQPWTRGKIWWHKPTKKELKNLYKNIINVLILWADYVRNREFHLNYAFCQSWIGCVLAFVGGTGTYLLNIPCKNLTETLRWRQRTHTTNHSWVMPKFCVKLEHRTLEHSPHCNFDDKFKFDNTENPKKLFHQKWTNSLK